MKLVVFFFNPTMAVPLFTTLFILIFPFSAHGQTTGQNAYTPHFFIAPLTEILYSRSSPAFGGGLAIGGSDESVAIGLRMLYAADLEVVQSLEIAVFLRFYPSGTGAGLFIQANSGMVIFTRNEALSLPADVGLFSGFLLAGWRFLLGSNKVRHFYIEPSFRVGTPYYFGAGVSGGIRF